MLPVHVVVLLKEKQCSDQDIIQKDVFLSVYKHLCRVQSDNELKMNCVIWLCKLSVVYSRLLSHFPHARKQHKSICKLQIKKTFSIMVLLQFFEKSLKY